MPIGYGGHKDKVTVDWIRPVSSLVNDFEDFERKVNRTQRVTFNKIKKILVEDAKANAPWTDRTGEARSTLHARYQTIATSAASKIVNVYLIYGVDYGVFLELARSGRYAIIHDTLVRNKAKIMEIMVESLKDFK